MSNKIKLKLGALNDPQKEAVTSKSKRVLILAGAGSGKTKVLTSRIAYLLANGVDPKAILSVTFTNKASAEMKERVVSLLDSQMSVDFHDMWMGTFHSVCHRFLKDYYPKKNYSIMDDQDQKKMVKNVLVDAGYHDTKAATVSLVMNFISKSKNLKLLPKESKKLEKYFTDIPNISEFYKLYEEYKDSMNLMDFDDLILKTVLFLENNANILNLFRTQFKHILVDEYQDTNILQDHFLKLLLREDKKNYLFVVGDDDQSIYGWRGAEVDNILKFDTTHEDVHVVKLEENYRSTQNILTAANAVIAKNELRHGKTLFTKQEDGSEIDIYQAANPDAEASYYVDVIRHYYEQGIPYSDMAILYRNNFISRSFETKLSESMIPYKLIGGVGFWARLEIKDVLSFLYIINNPHNDIQTERTLGILKGIGKKTIEKMRTYSKLNSVNLFDSIVDMLDKNEFKGKNKAILTHYTNVVIEAKSYIKHPYKLVKYIVNELELIEYYKEKEGLEKGSEREENINEMVSFIHDFKTEIGSNTLDDLFDMVSLQQNLVQNKDEQETVSLMTMHSAKGLEFPLVMLAGVESGILPSARSMSSQAGFEEERRLMYVSMTRAMKHLYISYAPFRFGGQSTGQSEFISDIPIDIIHSNDYKLINNKKRTHSSNFNNTNNNTVESTIPEEYSAGSTIEDEQYGEGVILATKKIGSEIFITVDFDFVGKKIIKK